MTQTNPLLPMTPDDEAVILSQRPAIQKALYQFEVGMLEAPELDSLVALFQRAANANGTPTQQEMENTYREQCLIVMTRALLHTTELHAALLNQRDFLLENRHIAKVGNDFIDLTNESIAKVAAMGFYYHQEASGALEIAYDLMGSKLASLAYNVIEKSADDLQAQIDGDAASRPTVAESDEEYLSLRTQVNAALSKGFQNLIVTNLTQMRQEAAFYSYVYGKGETPLMQLGELTPLQTRAEFCERQALLTAFLRENVYCKSVVDSLIARDQPTRKPETITQRPHLH